MFTAILIIAVALSSASCNKFVVGVRLLLPEHPKIPTPACNLLRSRALNRWREGAFSNCIFKHDRTIGRSFAASYSITVDPTKIPAFPIDETYAGRVAFVNQQLNLDNTSCLTVTGSHWGKPMQDSGIEIRAEFYMKKGANSLTPVGCNTIRKWLHTVGHPLKVISCVHEQLQYAPQILHQHRFILHAKVTTEDAEVPPTQNILNAILHTVSSDKSPQPNCIHVINAKYNPTVNTWSIELRVPPQNTRTSVCQTLIPRIGYQHVTCHTTAISNPQHNDTLQRVRVDIDAVVLDQSATKIDRVEAALRTHFLLNDKIGGCVVAKVDQLKQAFKRVPYKGYYSAVLSGPVGVYFCKMEKTRSAYTSHSCVVVRRPLEEGDYGVYRLLPKEPFYMLDLPWYMNKHHELVNRLNKGNSRCDFNGFIQLNTDDPIDEPNL